MEVIEGTVNLSFVPISSPPPLSPPPNYHHHHYYIFFDKVGYRPGSMKADVDLPKDLHTHTLTSVLRLTTPSCSMSATLYEQVIFRPTIIETD